MVDLTSSLSIDTRATSRSFPVATKLLFTTFYEVQVSVRCLFWRQGSEMGGGAPISFTLACMTRELAGNVLFQHGCDK